MFKFLKKYISNYRLILLVLGMLLISFFELIGLSLFIPIIDYFQSQDSKPEIIKYFSNLIIFFGFDPGLNTYLLILCIIFIIKTIITLIVRHMSVLYSADIQHELRMDIYNGYIKSNINFISKSKQGMLVSLINDHALRASSCFFIIIQIVLYSFTAIVFSIFVLIISWRLTLIAIAMSTLMYPIIKTIGKKAHISGRMLANSLEKTQQVAIETLQSKKLINAMDWGDDRTKIYKNFSNQVKESWYGTVFWSNSAGVIIQPISIIILSVLIALSMSFELSISYLGAFTLAFIRLLPIVQITITTNTDLKANLPSFDKVHDNLVKLVLQKEKSGPSTFELLKNKIELKNIVYSYHDNISILKDLNLKVKKGQTVALVGPSGSGKSTIADLILGLQLPNAGEVIIDDINLKDIDLKAYRQKISYIVQEPFLFNETIRNNLLIGIQDSLTDKQLVSICKQSNSWEFIKKKPQGLDTIIGDRGVELSGGQRQRICLTRALIRKPQILILDEATSSLDHESESAINRQLIDLSKTKKFTIIIIAHRFSTIKHADCIYQIKDGGAVNLGNWSNAQSILESIDKL